MISRRKIWLGELFSAIAAIVVWVIWPREREPVYSGKKLGEWTRMHRTGPSGNRATEAIRAIGTNALPWAVKWIGYETPKWKLKLASIAAKSPSGQAMRLLRFVDRVAPPPPPAGEIFEVLGTQAKSAAPELERLALRPGARGSRLSVLIALSWLGIEGLPALGRMLEKGDAQLQQMAMLVIEDRWMRGSDVAPVVPSLMIYFHAKRARHVSALDWNTLSFFNDPNVYEALTNCLTHSNAVVRLEAVRTLDEIVDLKTNDYRFVLEDRDQQVRKAATNLFFKAGRERR